MKSKTVAGAVSPLAELLPDAQFGEHHVGVVDAGREQVWRALHRMRWTDLRAGMPLMAVRGLAVPVVHDTVLETFTRRAGALLVEDEPASTMSVMIGQPWSAVPRKRAAGSVERVAGFDEPGWLVYGMDWVLHDLGDGRTLVETRTLCRATDATARRRFAAYWTLIRVFSGIMRLDMLAALGRLSQTAEPWSIVAPTPSEHGRADIIVR